MPILSVGTLDTLMGLSDDTVKLNTAVENVLRKIERQYYETAGVTADKMTVYGSSVSAFVKSFSWDVARYRYASVPIGDIMTQIQAIVTGVDEESKRLSITVNEKSQALAAAQRKKVINLATSDLEDFLTSDDIKKNNIDLNQNSEIFSTVGIAVPNNLDENFLKSYHTLGSDIACFGGPNWTEDKSSLGKDDGNYGSHSSRDRIKGSPVLPAAPIKLFSTSDSSLYTIQILKGHYEAGSLAEDGTFHEGQFVDYLAPLTIAAREKKFVIRRLDNFDTTKTIKGVDSQIEECAAQLQAIESRSIQWCQTHFGELYSAWIHLKIIRAFVESVLKYGLTYGKTAKFESFFMEAKNGKEKVCQERILDFFSMNSRTSTIILDGSNVIGHSDDVDKDEEEDDDLHNMIIQKFSLI